MKSQFCPICGPKTAKKLLYKQNFSLGQINAKVFSARRLPDRLHYRLVRCGSCGLVYSDPILDEAKIANLYHKSQFTYADRINDLTKTYGYYLRKLNSYGVTRNRFLEIGCGNGFMLAEAKRQGYREAWGVEPSRDAIMSASSKIKNKIKNSVFDQKLFPKNYFDVICFFQTFDHIINPNQFLKDCFELLKPGGLILAINHNIESFQAKLLREKSPIIDVEHTYLYNPRTMGLIFSKNQFLVLDSGPSFNYYPLDYIFHLLTLPEGLAPKIKLKFRLGNLFLIAQKPE